MSQRTIGNVIDKLLTDEDLRIRFVADWMEALAELCIRGFELSGDEIDEFHVSREALRHAVGKVGHAWGK